MICEQCREHFHEHFFVSLAKDQDNVEIGCLNFCGAPCLDEWKKTKAKETNGTFRRANFALTKKHISAR